MTWVLEIYILELYCSLYSFGNLCEAYWSDHIFTRWCGKCYYFMKKKMIKKTHANGYKMRKYVLYVVVYRPPNLKLKILATSPRKDLVWPVKSRFMVRSKFSIRKSVLKLNCTCTCWYLKMHIDLIQLFVMTLMSDTKTLGTESSITLQQTNHQTKTF